MDHDSQLYFTIVHQKNASIIAVELSATMDLVAMITNDGSVSLFRTFSWENIFTKLISDFQGFKGIKLKFNSIGNLLGILFVGARIGVIDVESAIFSMACPFHTQIEEIRDFSWGILQPGNSVKSVVYQNRNLTESMGMLEYPEALKSSKATLVSQKTSLLLSISSNFVMSGHINGVYPLFSVDVSPTMPHSFSSPLVSALFSDKLGLFYLFEHDPLSSSALHILRNSFLSREKVFDLHRILSLISDIESAFTKISDELQSFGRKWKEATKIILPKIQLLQSIIDGYQLNLNPIEFMFTVAQFGMWHPAASASFPNHWNEQGLNRLRASIDGTLTSIIRYLTLSAVPIVTNAILQTRDVLESVKLNFATARSPLINELIEEIIVFISGGKLILSKIEEANLEARLTHKNMTTFMNFIQDVSYNATTDKAKLISTDYTTKREYATLFDPRAARPSLSGLTAQAEAITGTYLYYYFQSNILELPNSKERSHGLSDFAPQKSQEIINSLQTISDISCSIEEIGISASTRHKLEGLKISDKNAPLLLSVKKHMEKLSRLKQCLFHCVSSHFESLLKSPMEANTGKTVCIHHQHTRSSKFFNVFEETDLSTFNERGDHTADVSRQLEHATSTWNSSLSIVDDAVEVIVQLTRYLNDQIQEILCWNLQIESMLNINFAVQQLLLKGKSGCVSILLSGVSFEADVVVILHELNTKNASRFSPADSLSFDVASIGKVIISTTNCKVRRLPLQDAVLLQGSGQRGIAVIVDSKGRFIVLDVDNDGNADVDEGNSQSDDEMI